MNSFPTEQINPNNPSATPFISTYRVSIRTISEIRYEGTLYQVNPEKKSIVLTDVVSFGTEGRMPNNEILGSNVVHDSIVFEGKDIKDLVVLESGDQQTNPKSTVVQPVEEQKKKIEVFDFELMNEKFQKLTLNDAKNNEKEFGKYSKMSFFDNISNSTTEKTRETKDERIHQTQIDKETFGADMILAEKNKKYPNNQNYKYRNYNRNYRGSYGGSGNYDNYNNNYNNNINYYHYNKYNNKNNNEEGYQYQSNQNKTHYNQKYQNYDDKNYEGNNNYRAQTNSGYRNNNNSNYNNYKSSNNYHSGKGGYQGKYNQSGTKDY